MNKHSINMEFKISFFLKNKNIKQSSFPFCIKLFHNTFNLIKFISLSIIVINNLGLTQSYSRKYDLILNLNFLFKILLNKMNRLITSRQYTESLFLSYF